jgi:type I restriction enzyme M protein
MLTPETKRHLDASRDILVGKLPLPTDQIELITLALIYKFMDDLDEESVKLGGKRSFFTGPLEKYRWRALLPQAVSADERMNLFAEGVEAIGRAEHLPALFRDIFRNSFLKFRDGRILTLFLNEVNWFEYSHSEELGNAFEYLLKTMGIQAENGQFRTPRHIIDFMVVCLDPQPSDRILDPACGTGGFLVSCYKQILAQHTSPGSTIAGDKLTHEQRQKVYSNLAGYDVTDLMVKLSKVNLFLHGFPDPAIHIYDTLTNDARWNEKADLILANPPFMTPKGGVSPHTKFRVSARKTEVLFTDYIAEHLTPDGRGGVIVPNGIVKTTQRAYVKLRKFLVEDSLVAVVSLPAGVFNPYSGVKTSILFLNKELARNIDKILFLKVDADGFDLGAQRKEIAQNDLPRAKDEILEFFRTSRTDNITNFIGTLGAAIEKKRILANPNILLNADRLLTETIGSRTKWPVVMLGDVCSFMTGGTPRSTVREYYENGDIPWLVSGDIHRYEVFDCEKRITKAGVENSNARTLPENSVLIALNGQGKTRGTVAILRMRNATCNQSLVAITPLRNEKLIPEYLFYVLRSMYPEIRALTGDNERSGLNIPIIKDIEIPLPPREEQQTIVVEIEKHRQEISRMENEIASR